MFIAPVEALVAEVPPRLPFQIPVPEQEVAFVELKEMVDDWPAVIVMGENCWRVTVGTEKQEFAPSFHPDDVQVTVRIYPLA